MDYYTYAMYLYVVSFVLLFAYGVVETYKEIKTDFTNRKKYEASEPGHSYYSPTVTVGYLLFNFAATLIPVVNTGVLIFDVAPRVLSRTFNQPLVPKRPKK